MSSPAKRRKKNDFQSGGPSSSGTKNLDFFFAKQKEVNQSSNVNHTTTSDAATTASTNTINTAAAKTNTTVAHWDNASVSGSVGPAHELTLTDEEVAKRLHEELNGVDLQSSGEALTEVGSGDQTVGEQARLEGSPCVGVSSGDARVELGRDGDSGDAAAAAAVALHEIESISPGKAKKETLSLQSTVAEQDTRSNSIPFDESCLTFNPQTYVSELRRDWAAQGGSATYSLLTQCFVLVSSTQSRIKIVNILVNFVRTLIEADPDSLLPAVWLATNSISPPYIDLELGLGGSSISKALKRVCGLDNASLKMLYNKYGDAGDVAFEAKKRQNFTLRKPKPLLIKGVFESLVKIASSKGAGSQEQKQRIVERLLQDARGAEESRYVVRTLSQHLRIGAVKTTMLIALSRAFLLSRPPNATFPVRTQSELVPLKKEQLAEVYGQSEEIVKACFARRPNYNDLVPALLSIGISDELLVHCGLALHIPLRPMLGSITRDLSDMLTKLQGRSFSCEYKYDGQRAQIHCDANGNVTIFSRHLEVMTDKYPDLVTLVPKIRGEGVESFLMEGEVVAVDKETGDLKPFQTLANRARKDVAVSSINIDVCLFAFDLMYLNGQELLDRSFRERRELLRSLFTEIPLKFTWVKNLDATSLEADAVLEFFKNATEIKCEGIMVKVLDNSPNADVTVTSPKESEQFSNVETKLSSKNPGKDKSTTVNFDGLKEVEAKKGTRRKPLLATYEPDKRLESWLKVKKDYNTSTDTLDLIPIGGWHGQGRKSKWWSPILLAIRDPDSGMLQAVTKCMSGFTDAFYIANRAKYDPNSANVIPRPSYVEYAGEPEVWFEPQEVWELVFADITLSPTYTAAIGLVSEDRGLSLRFPRFLKVREDKSIEEASDANFLAELWRKQESKVEGIPKSGVQADDLDGYW